MPEDLATPDTAAITDVYDRIGDVTAALLGGNIHLGYWADEHDTGSVREATDRVTDMVGTRLGTQPGDRVLDVGCGNGQASARLAAELGVEVVGITISDHHLAQAKQLRSAGNLAFRLADAMALPFPDGCFDAVAAIESISLMPQPERAVREIARVLKPGGRVGIVSAVVRGPLNGPDQEFFDRMCRIMTRPPFETPLSYHTMLADAGLYTESLKDIGDRVYKRSFEALVPADSAELDREYQHLGVSAEEVAALADVLREFGHRPQAGYLVAVARKPGSGAAANKAG
ncbi:MAG: methyltransferase domain-containing protein [Kibdelosporangium sp.]